MGKIDELLEGLENVSSKSINKDFEDGYNGGIRHALELIKDYKSSLPTEKECEQLAKMLKDYSDLSEKVGTLGNLTGKTIDVLINHIKVNGLPTQQAHFCGHHSCGSQSGV